MALRSMTAAMATETAASSLYSKSERWRFQLWAVQLVCIEMRVMSVACGRIHMSAQISMHAT